MKKYVLFMILILFFLSFTLFPPNAQAQEAKKDEKKVSRNYPRAWGEFMDLTAEQKRDLEIKLSKGEINNIIFSLSDAQVSKYLLEMHESEVGQLKLEIGDTGTVA